MITKRYDLLSGRKDKEGRTHWMKVGAAFPSKDGKDGFTIKLECFPLPDERGQCWIQAMPPRDRASTNPARSPDSSNDDMNDDIPF